MTNVSSPCPAGKVLISVSCNGILDFEDQELAEKSKGTRALVGKQVEDWSHLKTYKVKYKSHCS
jgi:hypothetical protein